MALKHGGEAGITATPPPLPKPLAAEAAAQLIARFAERGTAAQAYAATGEGAALLAAMGGHSPYLADLAVREPATLLRLAERGPDDALALALDPLGRADPSAARPQVAALLRQAQRQVNPIAAPPEPAGTRREGVVSRALLPPAAPPRNHRPPPL